ncbi:sensor histidine kinase [Aquibacillus koreensis]|uniref:Sensor histidine kinase n=1 Tax=Aquibacillus koreensis TaxID=279446 RepID=A0A9X3WK71_9BACI|nr:sensor histidine kinase [Aquibacillus koreensis]MCT2535577.1 sensor histidine kinase [Aquibacillus koreensis]MDC3420138.1 sensor histidine kinase [Aquibacillus koreensis]
MLKRLNSIRYAYIKSHFYALFLTTVTLLAILLSIFVLFEPTWLSATGIFVFISLYVVLAFLFSVYVGFKSSGDMKDRLDYLSVLIAQLARGNYSSRVYDNDDDEISRIGSELNGLGEKMQGQVKSLQRLADEKSEYAKSAHKAATIEERQRLARDLHDAVSQQLFALTMMSQASLRLFDRDPEQAREQVKEMSGTALKAQTEMRALLLHLRPVDLSGEPLQIGIHNLIEELKQKCQIDFHLHLEEVQGLYETTEEHLFRIVQEALSNILRHANATEVTLDIVKRNNELFVHIADNGKGFELDNHHQKKTSYGLKTMRERTEEIGGTFAIKSKKGEGTHIDIRIPLR